jgi:hypothetical protein
LCSLNRLMKKSNASWASGESSAEHDASSVRYLPPKLKRKGVNRSSNPGSSAPTVPNPQCSGRPSLFSSTVSSSAAGRNSYQVAGGLDSPTCRKCSRLYMRTIAMKSPGMAK